MIPQFKMFCSPICKSQLSSELRFLLTEWMTFSRLDFKKSAKWVSRMKISDYCISLLTIIVQVNSTQWFHKESRESPWILKEHWLYKLINHGKHFQYLQANKSDNIFPSTKMLRPTVLILCIVKSGPSNWIYCFMSTQL